MLSTPNDQDQFFVGGASCVAAETGRPNAHRPVIYAPLSWGMKLSCTKRWRLALSFFEEFLVAAMNLATNFARREVGRVDIDIATPALEQLHQRVEVTCWQALRGEPDHISGRDRPGYGSAARRARLDRGVVQVGAEKIPLRLRPYEFRRGGYAIA